jgi:catechol 2,3-dioxygenase-like lactoylglutathione lyase family enzyme
MNEFDEGPPTEGWARLAPALIVSDLERSLSFWQEVLGFQLAYARREDDFFYLERAGAQVMLYERCGLYETGPLEHPFGRGIMLQIQVDDVDAILSALRTEAWPLTKDREEAWFRAGTVERGLLQFIVLDPDGYMLMIYQEIGVRPVAARHGRISQ